MDVNTCKTKAKYKLMIVCVYVLQVSYKPVLFQKVEHLSISSNFKKILQTLRTKIRLCQLRLYLNAVFCAKNLNPNSLSNITFFPHSPSVISSPMFMSALSVSLMTAFTKLKKKTTTQRHQLPYFHFHLLKVNLQPTLCKMAQICQQALAPNFKT